MLDSLRSTLGVRKVYRRRWFIVLRNYVKLIVPSLPQRYSQVDDRSQLDGAEKVLITWPKHRPKPRVGLMRDRGELPYWTKFERFLRNNQIPFDYYEAHQSNWMAAAGQFDVLLWVPEEAVPYCVEEIRRKMYILENFCGKSCFPSFDTLMWHEDKLTQYELLRMNGFPVVETFISHNLEEVLATLPRLEYPLVAKSSTGAGSMAVELVKDRWQAERISKAIFSSNGRATFWPYFRQKDCVYFQKFQPNSGYDLRVIAVGNKVFGYYRDVPHGEFRASGMGLVRKEAIPADALQLAWQLARKFDWIMVAVDMLRDPAGKLHITELSAFIEVGTAVQLEVDGVPGVYVFDSSGAYHFEPGKFWIQELTLKEFLERWLRKQKSS